MFCSCNKPVRITKLRGLGSNSNVNRGWRTINNMSHSGETIIRIFEQVRVVDYNFCSITSSAPDVRLSGGKLHR